MSESLRTTRSFLGRVIAIAALLAMSLIVAIDHVRITRLEQSRPPTDYGALLEGLSSRYAAVSEDVQALKDEPRGPSREAIEALRSEWIARTSQLQDMVAASAAAADLSAVKDQLKELDARYFRAKRKAAAPAPSPEPAASVSPGPPVHITVEPPFVPLGFEQRGGQRFLTILPPGVSSLAKARALHAGEREGTWLLLRVERDAAYFQVDGQLRRVSVPR